MNDADLLALLAALDARGYAFVPPTPATHARVVARPARQTAHDLAGIFGWSLPFAPGVLDAELAGIADRAGVLERHGDLWRSRLRVARLHGRLFLHSAFPTASADAVFLGPDSYRFADLIVAELGERPAGARIVDIGAGAGVGGIVAAGCCPTARITLTDINPRAIDLARINAAHAGIAATLVETDGLAGIAPGIDVALANPPFLIDADHRAYRHGGGLHGGEVSIAMARAAAERLNPGGRLILYTASAIVGGEDRLRSALTAALAEQGCDLRYREIDPDVFGEELASPAYADVDRIALVSAVATKSG